METIAIIVAAGRGSRAGEGLPKQYRALAGRTVLGRTLQAFASHPGVGRILCAIHPDDRALYESSVAELDPALRRKLLAPAAGGATRQISVRQALAALPPGDGDAIVLVHDAARPFVEPGLIERAIEAGVAHGAAIPGLAVTDTVKRVGPDGAVCETLDRAALRSVQTPQAFRRGPLAAAHARAAAEGEDAFTDDGQLMEWAGATVYVVDGDSANVKLTSARDFEEAERRLAGRGESMITRVGTGFDVHTFTEGDHIWLGGLRIPHTKGVLAHSDGDVVLHALTDALLGAIACGDIGTHFPPSDPQWKGASSDRFLDHAAKEVRSRGGRIDHLDVTVLCERPRIGQHREAMRERIAAIAGVPVENVSIKATTTEKMGFTGREEGLAAQAAATIRMPERA
ncbi:bifunctional 2-C-methyl-D-erythritol 4-phosphate cytidylyltransferase/2-C-methyl-D-erythritol 2,4-cyclodiphosphate synthase [Enterovirga aerilata]|uniref:Bifunctional enzyme IspD/IspF n=1 Tax=Enterovirga aerilata TaxID=2730920 RepID=A0A849HYB5_9HYPH|nr:bifunctional 2-C-methyl-D-erythritol 4-phosphate cytidylyltransferase/2-C-methyl-D-erythritol 2,4-cyclodiphosphate synthase [Enterovirga sp. DB1703]NNM72102.1 bifunctional 2-C-methyl-D-erythritol 4-phosphate cytidylyltransferase/2-C-methyl-D-erythritol 2,4-cyclodiphosphate synthase [Enterovirga sp. DB1703]